MKTKNFDDYLKTRFSKEEIKKIEMKAQKEYESIKKYEKKNK